MNHGFIKVAAITPKIRVADPLYNAEQVIAAMREAAGNGSRVLVFPELVLTGYTCGDLFLQQLLLEQAEEALYQVLRASKELNAISFIGTVWRDHGCLYNVLAVVNRGNLIGLIPKKNIPNYGEFYEKRHFEPGPDAAILVPFRHEEEHYMVPLGTDILFTCGEVQNLVLAAEVCEDVWAPMPPSIRHALAGATVIVNGSASDEAIGKGVYRRDLVTGQSGRLLCGYVYASAGEGESSTDLVFGGHNLIAENGSLLAESRRFQNETVTAVIDVDKLESERRRNTSFPSGRTAETTYIRILFHIQQELTALPQPPSRTPFVPTDKKNREERCEEILSIQEMGLKKRLEHTGCRHAVIGISGGLDSTLALLVTVKAFDDLGLPRNGIHAITMPCFGTTDRTYKNACIMAQAVGASLQEIPIRDAVRTHFRDIGHDESVHDVTYENGQARERTQVLMDVANQIDGMVIGTGDMSELALGWATYNGDHMAMYGVNAGVPKTLVRHLVHYYAETSASKELAAALFDVLDTPVSPELLPPEEGKISQKTEDLVGPYELHDFFLYYMLRYGFAPDKIYRLALLAFDGSYEPIVIRKWLYTFYRRFFSQQFKRSCLPDGPKVGSVAISPRGDWRMPSDASGRIWLEQIRAIDEIEKSFEQ